MTREGPGQRSSRTLYRIAVVGSLVLMAATGLRPAAESADGMGRILGLLNLGSENNVASWWAGMLFLLAAAYAWDCSARARREAPGAETAWMGISGILLFFSADEVSSFHERMGGGGITVGFTWLSDRDILAIALAVVAFLCLLRLWRTPGQRRPAVGLFLGFLVLATIYPQETLEHVVEWSGEGVQRLRLLVEEGTELLGSLVFLRVAMNRAFPPATFGGLKRLSPPGILAGVLVCVILAVLTARLPDQQRGHPADWLAAALFLAAGIRVVRPLFRGEDRSLHVSRDLAALICIVASMLTVALPPLDLVSVGSFWLNLRLSTLAAFAFVLAIMRYRDHAPALVIVAAAAATALVAVGWSLHLMLVYLFTQLVALAVYWSASVQPPRRRVSA